MSHDKNGTHYENQQQTTTFQSHAGQPHRLVEHEGGKQGQRTSYENSGPDSAQFLGAHEAGHCQAANRHELITFGHKEIEALAYELWQTRGCPFGSSEDDWLEAAKQLRSRNENRPRH
jgi:hypothetical protein